MMDTKTSMEVIHGLSHGVTILNFIFLLGTCIYIYNLIRKIDKLFGVNAINLIESTQEILKRLELMNRLQILMTKMINEDRAKLSVHDGKVDDLRKSAEDIMNEIRNVIKK